MPSADRHLLVRGWAADLVLPPPFWSPHPRSVTATAQAVAAEVSGRVQPVSAERDALHAEAHELRVKVKYLGDDLARAQVRPCMAL